MTFKQQSLLKQLKIVQKLFTSVATSISWWTNKLGKVVTVLGLEIPWLREGEERVAGEVDDDDDDDGGMEDDDGVEDDDGMEDDDGK